MFSVEWFIEGDSIEAAFTPRAELAPGEVLDFEDACIAAAADRAPADATVSFGWDDEGDFHVQVFQPVGVSRGAHATF